VSTTLDGFRSSRIKGSDDVEVHVRSGGSGPPLLLLHGCPQTSLMWRRVAPVLAERFTVVLADLRGYGQTSAPAGLPDHANYSFRAMALDQVHVMDALGFASFGVAGHDRGGRVAHRLALDHPDRVEKLALLDILPTLTMYAATDRTFATAYWEWFFLTQDRGFPEALIGAAPEAFLDHELGELRRRGVVDEAAWRAYVEALADPRAVHGMCEDYRAGASIDLEHDRLDLARRIGCPVLALWGEQNEVWGRFDVLEVWRERAIDVSGQGLPCGHYLAEEEPTLTAGLLGAFFA
jgi:haloacetate dehalogenase